MISLRCSLVLIATLCAPVVASAEDVFRFPGSDAHRQHYYVTAYRDLSGAGGGLKDWNCGTKTYDGHGGTDLGVGGFPGMDAGRDVVAAAAGMVTFVNDGAADRCTSGNCAGGGGFGNYVRIAHADGKVTYYGHLKRLSVAVEVGQTVTCGQKLGQVGSSGNSTGPHLHFEPRVGGVGDDPFSGPCGGSISWWVAQGAYQSLPETGCQNAPRSHAVLALDLALDPIVDQVPDSRSGGESNGIFDLEPEQTVTARFSITNQGALLPARDVVVGLDAAGGFLTVVDWQVFDNFPGNGCGGALCPNDANEHPLNPPHVTPGEALELRLNAVSPGETKTVVVKLKHRAPTHGAAPHAPVRLWVKNVEGSYSKPSFDAVPDNVDGAQTFNAGDLSLMVAIDTWGAEDGPPTDGGGCAAGTGTGTGVAAPIALLLLGFLRRRRRHVATA